MSGLPLLSTAALVMLAAAAVGHAVSLPQEVSAPPQVVAPTPTVKAPAVPNGLTLFQERGCTHCHGANASGTERGPSLQSVGRTWSREKIEHQLRDGGAAMPAFGSVLSDTEVQSLLDFLVLKRAPVAHPRRRTP